jgi:hypothetical protein
MNLRRLLLTCWALLATASAIEPIVIKRSGTYRWDELRDYKAMPRRVVEYGSPALHVRADNVQIDGFAWRGSMEGVHVGSRPFTPEGMRQRHLPIRVELRGLFCNDVGEDALAIQPRAIVTLRDSSLTGRYRRWWRTNRDTPGRDKLIQIDGANVTIIGCKFYRGVCAVRVRANSRVTLRDCEFFNCDTCVYADGAANPRSANPYDNGQPGLSNVTLINCRAHTCQVFAYADVGGRIRIDRCPDIKSARLEALKGGQIETIR